MLTIRAAQMSVLADDVGTRFNELLAEHLQYFTPREAQALGREGLRSVVRLVGNEPHRLSLQTARVFAFTSN